MKHLQDLSNIKINMPLFLCLDAARIKKTHINLNNYRNWHHQKSNKLKKLYTYTAHNELQAYKFINLKKIKIIFTLIRGDKRRIDRSNVLSVHEKFFCDALVSFGIIKDDNDSVIIETNYKSGLIDKLNPRVMIEIIEL